MERRALPLIALVLGACSAPFAPDPVPTLAAAAPSLEAPARPPAASAVRRAPSPRLETPAPTVFVTAAPIAPPTTAPGVATSPGWRRYSSAEGPAIFLPPTWVVIDPALYPESVSFAAAPSHPGVALERQAVLAVIHVIRRDRPFADARDLADSVQAGIPGLDGAERTGGSHPSGDVVILKYPIEIGGLPLLLEADALFVRDGVGIVLGMRAPLERMDEYADTFEEMFRRLRL